MLLSWGFSNGWFREVVWLFWVLVWFWGEYFKLVFVHIRGKIWSVLRSSCGRSKLCVCCLYMIKENVMCHVECSVV
jgi:hypothetical protein